MTCMFIDIIYKLRVRDGKGRTEKWRIHNTYYYILKRIIFGDAAVDRSTGSSPERRIYCIKITTGAG